MRCVRNTTSGLYGAISHWAIIASGSPKQLEFYAFSGSLSDGILSMSKHLKIHHADFWKTTLKFFFNGISILVEG